MNNSKKDKEMKKALGELGKELTRYNNKDNFAKAFDKHFKKKRKSSI